MRTATLVLLLVLAGLQVRLWVGVGSIHEVRQLEDQVSRQLAENERLQVRNDLLRAEVKDLRDSLESIEERARHDLGLIRRDETFFLMPGEPG